MKILILLSALSLILTGTGDINAFNPYPQVKAIVNEYAADYDSKFTHTFTDGPIYSGEATAYGSLTSGGNCLFPSVEYYNDMMYAAINGPQYFDDLGCGLCAVVVSTSSPNKPIRVRVLDRCPECKHGDLDLSDKAYRELTGQGPGREQITWALIPCDISIAGYPALVEAESNIKFKFKCGSSQWWMQVQIFNTVYPVASVEMKVNGQYLFMSREEHNFWSKPNADIGPGPYTFRVTLADSTVIVAQGLEMVTSSDEGGDYSTGTQTVTHS